MKEKEALAIPEDGDLVPWLPDDQETRMPKSELALHIAATQVGVVETSWNSSPMIDKYLGLVKLKKVAWCASFVYWCLRRAGISRSSLPKRWKAPAVRFWVAWAKKEGRITKTPNRGYLFFWLNGTRGHIGFVNRVGGNGLFRTIEGNTNFRGAREGDGVYRKKREIRTMDNNEQWGFISLENLK